MVGRVGSSTVGSQQKRHIYPMFDHCWPTVYDVGPTVVKHWIDVSCLLGGVIRDNVELAGSRTPSLNRQTMSVADGWD